jgi:hypothetical protein
MTGPNSQASLPKSISDPTLAWRPRQRHEQWWWLIVNLDFDGFLLNNETWSFKASVIEGLSLTRRRTCREWGSFYQAARQPPHTRLFGCADSKELCGGDDRKALGVITALEIKRFGFCGADSRHLPRI